jgi:hypothetical protein
MVDTPTCKNLLGANNLSSIVEGCLGYYATEKDVTYK